MYWVYNGFVTSLGEPQHYNKIEPWFKKLHTRGGWIYLIKNTFTASLCHQPHHSPYNYIWELDFPPSDDTNTGCTVHDACYAILYIYPGPVFNHLAPRDLVKQNIFVFIAKHCYTLQDENNNNKIVFFSSVFHEGVIASSDFPYVATTQCKYFVSVIGAGFRLHWSSTLAFRLFIQLQWDLHVVIWC